MCFINQSYKQQPYPFPFSYKEQTTSYEDLKPAPIWLKLQPCLVASELLALSRPSADFGQGVVRLPFLLYSWILKEARQRLVPLALSLVVLIWKFEGCTPCQRLCQV